jgi:hypothetical protein
MGTDDYSVADSSYAGSERWACDRGALIMEWLGSTPSEIDGEEYMGGDGIPSRKKTSEPTTPGNDIDAPHVNRAAETTCNGHNAKLPKRHKAKILGSPNQTSLAQLAPQNKDLKVQMEFERLNLLSSNSAGIRKETSSTIKEPVVPKRRMADHPQAPSLPLDDTNENPEVKESMDKSAIPSPPLISLSKPLSPEMDEPDKFVPLSRSSWEPGFNAEFAKLVGAAWTTAHESIESSKSQQKGTSNPVIQRPPSSPLPRRPSVTRVALTNAPRHKEEQQPSDTTPIKSEQYTSTAMGATKTAEMERQATLKASAIALAQQIYALQQKYANSTPTQLRAPGRAPAGDKVARAEQSLDQGPSEIEERMSLFQGKLAAIDMQKYHKGRDEITTAAQRDMPKHLEDREKQQNYRDAAMAAAQRNVSEYLKDMDEYLFYQRPTGGTDKVYIGSGVYMDKSDIEAIARARLDKER